MLKILLPVDGSDSSNKSAPYFIQSIDCYKETPEIHLLNVQLPLDGNISLESIKKRGLFHFSLYHLYSLGETQILTDLSALQNEELFH